MKKLKLLLLRLYPGLFLCAAASVLLFIVSCKKQKIPANGRTNSFDEDWHFMKDSLQSAYTPDFDDSGWRIIDIPHDWSIEDLPGQNGVDIIGPFKKSAIDKGSSAYLEGGIGWYRKSFTISENDKDKIVYLQFDGVSVRSDVWLNGKHLGFHPYGYTPFYYDLTPWLNPPDRPNVVTVRVKNEGMTSRWYAGSGIIRHVWLTLADPVHIDVSGGLCITTPVVADSLAQVKIETLLVNSSFNAESIVLCTVLKDPSGREAATITSNATVEPRKTKQVIQEVQLNIPSLWSIDEPNLYQAKVSVLINDTVVDDVSTYFGIRDIEIDPEKGFSINGKQVKLIGGNIHHDNGPLGAAAIDRAEERKIEILKKNGFNAIRTAHNPPSSALLDACDKLGMVVIDEIFDNWESAKRNQDYHLFFREWWRKDVESWIKRDRNHPSVIIWSIGNEVREAYDSSGLRIARDITGCIRQLDPSRSVTECFVDFAWMRGQKSKWDENLDHMQLLDLIGYNYAYKRYEEDHIKYPGRVMVGTETNPPLALENYEMVRKHPYVIGYFVWTAMDNLGEAGRGMPQIIDIEPDTGQLTGAGAGFNRDVWPVFTNYQGDIDLTGNRKVPSYYQHVVWDKSKVEMFVHRPIPKGKREVTSNWGFPDELKSWNWAGHDGEKFLVHVYTRSQKVRLELNGRVIGEQNTDSGKSITTSFEVPWEAGTLVARCFDNGRETASQVLSTTGKPATLRLIADRTTIRADRNDLAFIRAEITDVVGNIVPDADEVTVNFDVRGSGMIAGVGNGNPSDMSGFQQHWKKAYQGTCLAVVRPENTRGKIHFRATAKGLKEAALTISVE